MIISQLTFYDVHFEQEKMWCKRKKINENIYVSKQGFYGIDEELSFIGASFWLFVPELNVNER